MNQITGIVRALLQGLVDSITGTTVVFYLDREMNKKLLAAQEHRHNHHHHGELAPASSASTSSQQRRPNSAGNAAPNGLKEPESNVRMRVLNCCLLNGGIFWLSINLFEYGVLPVMQLLLRWIFASNASKASYVWSWTQPFVSLLFGMVWVLPLFIISRLVNSLWFQDIANSAYKFRQGRPQTIGISKLIADTLFSLVVQMLFLVQIMVVQQTPVQHVGQTLAFVHMCLLYSLYAFEYKWFNMGWELHKRLTFIEYNWPYFIGFGVPLAVLTQLTSSYIVSGCIFSTLFPFFILSANEASPMINSCSYPLKLFSPVVALANAVFSKTVDPARNAPAPPSSLVQPPPTPATGPATPSVSQRHSVSQQAGGRSSSHRLPQTVHGVDMSAFLSAAAATASAAQRRQASQQQQQRGSSGLSSTRSHRSSPAPATLPAQFAAAESVRRR